MEENKMIEMEEVKTNEEIATEVEHDSMGAGAAMLIGSVLTLAVIAGVKKGRQLWANHKAKKDATDDGVVVDGDIIDITEASKEAEEDKE